MCRRTKRSRSPPATPSRSSGSPTRRWAARCSRSSRDRAGAATHLLVRLLDALALLLGGLALAILATGGWRLGPLPLTRAEDAVVAIALLAGLRALLRPYRLPAVDPRRALLTGVALYLLLMGFVVVSRHVAMRTHALDLGQPVQVIWNMARGAGPMLTQIPGFVTADRMSRWGDHFEPILWLFVPLAWVWPGAESLLLAQAVLLALGALGVYAYASARIDPKAGAAFALLYLLNPTLHGINVRDVHPTAFAIPLLIGAAYAFERGRYVWCAAALALTFATREDAAIAVVGFASWLAFAHRRWAVGAALAVVAVAVLFVDLHYVIPYYRGEGAPYNHLYRYTHLGSSLGEILTTIVVRPWRWAGVVLSGGRLPYLLALLAPLGFLAVFAPRVALAALPGLAQNLMSNDYRLYSFRSQYQAFVLPFLVLAAVEGYRALQAGERRRWATRLLAFGFVASAVLASPIVNDLGVSKWALGERQRAAYRLMAKIPRDASVSANERLVPHMSLREEVWVFPLGVPKARYVLDFEQMAPKLPPGRYEPIAKDADWVLWERRN